MADVVRTDHPLLEPEASESTYEPLVTPVGGAPQGNSLSSVDWRTAVGGLLFIAGFLALALAWWGASGTRDTNAQLAYIVSGGAVGAALILVAVTCLVAYEHARDRQALAELEAGLHKRLADLEAGLAGEFAELYRVIQGRTPMGEAGVLQADRVVR